MDNNSIKQHSEIDVINFVVKSILSKSKTLRSDRELMKGVIVENRDLWLKTFNHESSTYIVDNYEKVEYIGDKMINLYHAMSVIKRFPDATEKDMSIMVSVLQSNVKQAIKSEEQNLSSVLSYIGDKKYGIDSDLLEAVVGALWISSNNIYNGIGNIIAFEYLDSIYNDEDYTPENLPRTITKTDMLNLVKDKGDIGTRLQNTVYRLQNNEYLYMLYIDYKQKAYFTSFGLKYIDARGSNFIYNGVDTYESYTFEDIMNNKRRDLIELLESNNLVSESQKIVLLAESENDIVVPRYVTGYAIADDIKQAENLSYNDMSSTFLDIGITNDLVLNIKRQLSIMRIIKDKGMQENYEAFKRRHSLRREDTLYFKSYPKLENTISLVLLIGGKSTVLNSMSGEDENMIKSKLLTELFYSSAD